MHYYYFAFLITGLLLFIKDKTKALPLYFFYGLVVLLLLGFRADSVGIDTAEYHHIFDMIQNNPSHPYLGTKIQFLFIFLNKLVGKIGGANLLIFVSSFIILFFTLVTLFKFSLNLGLSLLIFMTLGVFFFYHSGIRQSLAISLVLYSTYFIYRKSLFKYSIIILVAFYFHVSAIFAIPLYFFSKIKLNTYLILFIWIISIVFIIDDSLIFYIFEKIIFFAPKQYHNYLYMEGVYTKGGQGLGITLIFKQILFLLLILSLNRINKAEHINLLFIQAAILGILLGNILHNIGYLGRLANYYNVFLTIAIPLALKKMFNYKNYMLSLVMMFFLLSILFVRAIYTDVYRVFPYVSFINIF